MPVPDEFIIAPDFTACVYCGKTYADTAENMHRVMIEKDGARRIYKACVHCIARAKAEPEFEEFMTEKTFSENLGRKLKPERTIKPGVENA